MERKCKKEVQDVGVETMDWFSKVHFTFYFSLIQHGVINISAIQYNLV